MHNAIDSITTTSGEQLPKGIVPPPGESSSGTFHFEELSRSNNSVPIYPHYFCSRVSDYHLLVKHFSVFDVSTQLFESCRDSIMSAEPS
jgi:hypothetical protein